MTTVNDIYEYIDSIAPFAAQMGFDNSGLQLGRRSAEVKTALLSLDVTDIVIDEAIRAGAQLIISHHPLIFTAIKCVDDEKLLRLAENGIAVISAHTSLDIAEGGVNDVLMRLLGAEPECALDAEGCGRIGTLPVAAEFDDFLHMCRDKLNTNGLRYYSAGKAVKRLAVMGGAGGDCVRDAFAAGCDTYVTSDIKYHQFLEAAELGLNLIDGDHFCTEAPVMPVLFRRLSGAFPDVGFVLSRKHSQVVSFI